MFIPCTSDPEKKKYFAIAKNHTVPTNSPYSADQIKKRKAQDTAAAQKRDISQANQKRIKRVGLAASVRGACSRETDGHTYRNTVLEVYTELWRHDRVVIGSRPGHRQRKEQAIGRGIGAFDVHMDTLIFSGDGPNLYTSARDKRHREVRRVDEQSEAYVPHWEDHIILYTGRDVINTINIDPTTNLALTTWHAPTMGHNAYITKLAGNGRFDLTTAQKQWRIENVPVGGRHRYDSNASTVRCATVAPPSSALAFVVGGDHEIFGIQKDGQTSFLTSSVSNAGYGSFALEFLAESPAILLAGKRSGAINVLDLRARNCLSQTATMFHASSVSRIKQINEHTVVVSGLESTMAIYDLRYTKKTERRHMLPASHFKHSYRRNNMFKAPCYTYPVITIIDHENEFRHDADMAVDRETGLIAAAQVDDLDSPVKLFDSRTGDLVKTLGSKELGWEPIQDGPYSKQLRWVEDRGKNLPKALWVARGHELYTCSW